MYSSVFPSIFSSGVCSRVFLEVWLMHWMRNCSADHTATQTIGHSSTDISIIWNTQRPWSFVQDLRHDEIRGWWWWWWWWINCYDDDDKYIHKYVNTWELYYHSADRKKRSVMVGRAKSTAQTSSPKRHTVVNTDGSRYQIILHDDMQPHNLRQCTAHNSRPTLCKYN